MTLPPLDTPIPHDFTAIENGGKRFHLTATETVEYRWEPYKPDGQRQMNAKGRWQRMEVNGDFHRWVNCERPIIAPADEIAALQARVTELEGFIRDFAEAKFEALRQPYCPDPQDEEDPVTEALTVWAWQEDARATLKGADNDRA